ncbi:MAG: D-alanyl-D-alanine carboxypeptidase family protein [Pedococcus sp.]
MTLFTRLAARRPVRLAVVTALGLGVVVAGAAAATAAVGHVRTQSTPLTVRSGPGTGFEAVGSVAKGAKLNIVCQTKGTRVSGPYGATSVWNKIGEGRYVADAFTSASEPGPTCTSGAGAVVAGLGKACSGNERIYPNGRVPRSALCSLRGEPGESLRPRAAAAFNALSAAFEKANGRPLCVTDSYRSYDEQVAVKASKGKWAATPGRSEHGLGHALDLCGGVDRFGTTAHRWMQTNAPRFGWVHPGWAQANGPLPEPWHWEYAG